MHFAPYLFIHIYTIHMNGFDNGSFSLPLFLLSYVWHPANQASFTLSFKGSETQHKIVSHSFF